MSTPFAPLSGADSVTDATPAVPAYVELAGRPRDLYAELVEHRRQRDQHAEAIEYLTAQLQTAIGDAPEAHVDGRPVISYRPHTRREFVAREAKRLLTAEQIEACTVERVVRPFRLVDNGADQ